MGDFAARKAMFAAGGAKPAEPAAPAAPAAEKKPVSVSNARSFFAQAQAAAAQPQPSASSTAPVSPVRRFTLVSTTPSASSPSASVKPVAVAPAASNPAPAPSAVAATQPATPVSPGSVKAAAGAFVRAAPSGTPATPPHAPAPAAAPTTSPSSSVSAEDAAARKERFAAVRMSLPPNFAAGLMMGPGVMIPRKPTVTIPESDATPEGEEGATEEKDKLLKPPVRAHPNKRRPPSSMLNRAEVAASLASESKLSISEVVEDDASEEEDQPAVEVRAEKEPVAQTPPASVEPEKKEDDEQPQPTFVKAQPTPRTKESGVQLTSSRSHAAAPAVVAPSTPVVSAPAPAPAVVAPSSPVVTKALPKPAPRQPEESPAQHVAPSTPEPAAVAPAPAPAPAPVAHQWAPITPSAAQNVAHPQPQPSQHNQDQQEQIEQLKAKLEQQEKTYKATKDELDKLQAQYSTLAKNYKELRRILVGIADTSSSAVGSFPQL